MTQQRFIIAFVQGTAEELNHSFVKTPGMTVVEVPEDTYDYLYNSLLEKAASERRAQP
jgi:hypothetical protein